MVAMLAGRSCGEELSCGSQWRCLRISLSLIQSWSAAVIVMPSSTKSLSGFHWASWSVTPLKSVRNWKLRLLRRFARIPSTSATKSPVSSIKGRLGAGVVLEMSVGCRGMRVVFSTCMTGYIWMLFGSSTRTAFSPIISKILNGLYRFTSSLLDGWASEAAVVKVFDRKTFHHWPFT